VTASLALTCWIAAAGVSDGAETMPNRLVLRMAAPPAAVAALTARLAPRLTALGVTLEATVVPEVNVERVLEQPPDSGPEAPLARGWVIAQDIDSAVVLLIPRGADRVLVRRVPLVLGVDEAGLAEITFIIERSLASVLASQPIGVPQAEARAALGAASAARAATGSSRETAVRVGIFGGVASWSSTSTVVARFGLDVWIDRVAETGRWGLAASAAVDPGFHQTDSNGDLLVRAAALHAYLTAGTRLGQMGIGRLAVGPALLVTRIAPTLSSSSATETVVQSSRTDVDPMIGFAARWDLRLGRLMSLFLAATVDVVPLRAQYVEVVSNGANRVLFSPWSVRPALLLGVSAGSDRR